MSGDTIGNQDIITEHVVPNWDPKQNGQKKRKKESEQGIMNQYPSWPFQHYASRSSDLIPKRR